VARAKLGVLGQVFLLLAYCSKLTNGIPSNGDLGMCVFYFTHALVVICLYKLFYSSLT
jgi:hypothetical protein